MWVDFARVHAADRHDCLLDRTGPESRELQPVVPEPDLEGEACSIGRIVRIVRLDRRAGVVDEEALGVVDGGAGQSEGLAVDLSAVVEDHAAIGVEDLRPPVLEALSGE